MRRALLALLAARQHPADHQLGSEPRRHRQTAQRHDPCELAQSSQAAKTQIGIVGMQVDERTRAAEQLRTFVESTGLPVLGYVRNTQNYVQLAARGLTVFDLAPERVARDLGQWQSICAWLDQ